MNPTMLLIDASSFIHRAFHAAPPRVTGKGEHVGALYITIKMLRNLINNIHPKWVATVFDHPESTFRHQLYPEYKANRDPKPPELEFQLDQLRLVTGGMGLNPIMVRNVEADDVIATIASACTQQKVTTLVATRDKDLAAIVNPYVSLIDKDGEITDPAKVKERFGVDPGQITDWLTLKGDESDNIPGIQGCGEKKAAALLAKYGSLDRVIANADKIPGVLGERLRANIDQVQKMRQIVQLKDDLCIMKDPACYSRRGLNHDWLLEMFNQFEFVDMHNKLKERLAMTG